MAGFFTVEFDPPNGNYADQHKLIIKSYDGYKGTVQVLLTLQDPMGTNPTVVPALGQTYYIALDEDEEEQMDVVVTRVGTATGAVLATARDSVTVDNDQVPYSFA
jgi:hypothetical protein